MILGFTSVVGDLWHAGHVAMIQECRRKCDRLLVAVMADVHDRVGKNQPVQSLFERTYQVACTQGVDVVLSCESEDDLLLALKAIRPDIRFVGDDYINRTFTGKEYCENNGIRILYTSRHHGFSSTELRKRIENGKK